MGKKYRVRQVVELSPKMTLSEMIRRTPEYIDTCSMCAEDCQSGRIKGYTDDEVEGMTFMQIYRNYSEYQLAQNKLDDIKQLLEQIYEIDCKEGVSEINYKRSIYNEMLIKEIGDIINE